MTGTMRFFTTREADTDLTVLERALAKAGDGWRLVRGAGGGETAEVFHGRDLLGEVAIARPGDGFFEEDLAEIAAFFAGAEADDPRLAALDAASAAVVLDILDQGRGEAETRARLEPLWALLFARLGGVLQDDGDGLHDADGGYTPES